MYGERLHLALLTLPPSLSPSLSLSLSLSPPPQDAGKALTQFNMIITHHQVNFSPAYYGVGKSLVLLHNHQEARQHVKRGLELLPSYRVAPLTWPGTSTLMVECMPHDVEVGVVMGVAMSLFLKKFFIYF